MRASNGCARTCSGDMYATVPSVLPGFGQQRLRTSGCLDRRRRSPPVRSADFASPKSRIFGPRGVRKMFAGLMSRCTMPVRCAASRASATANAMSTSDRDLHRAASEPLLECLAFEQLHRDERWIGADIVDGADVGVVERRGRPRFPLETFQRLRRRGDPVRQHFDRHHPFETRVRGPIHFAHPAGAERADDFVGAEASAGSKGQGSSDVTGLRSVGVNRVFGRLHVGRGHVQTGSLNSRRALSA